MKYNDLCNIVAKEQNISQKKAKDIVKSVFDNIIQVMADEDEILIPGFAKFSTQKRKARVGTNLADCNKQKVIIPAKRISKFIATKNLKSKVEKIYEI